MFKFLLGGVLMVIFCSQVKFLLGRGESMMKLINNGTKVFEKATQRILPFQS